METLLLAVDVLLMVLLLLAVRRRERAKPDEGGELGMFSYQERIVTPAKTRGASDA